MFIYLSVVAESTLLGCLDAELSELACFAILFIFQALKIIFLVSFRILSLVTSLLSVKVLLKIYSIEVSATSRSSSRVAINFLKQQKGVSKAVYTRLYVLLFSRLTKTNH